MREVRSERSAEANELRADLKAGRVMRQALHQAKLAYRFNPSAYSYECLSAVHRLQQQLRKLQLTVGEGAGCSSTTSPQQDDEHETATEQNNQGTT